MTVGKPVSAATDSAHTVSPRRSGRIPLRLDVHGADDPQAVPVAPEVVDQIAPPNGAVVAVPPLDRGLVAEPGVVIPLEVPEVVVGVDDEVVPAADVVDVTLIVGTEPQVFRTPLRPVVVHREALSEDVVQADEHPPHQHRREGVPTVAQEHVGDGEAAAERDEGDAVPRPPGANPGRPTPERCCLTAGAPVHVGDASRSSPKISPIHGSERGSGYIRCVERGPGARVSAGTKRGARNLPRASAAPPALHGCAGGGGISG